MKETFDVLLINTDVEEKRNYAKSEFLPSMGLLNIGTYLYNNGFTVKIIDTRLSPNYMEEIIEQIKKTNLLVGFTVMTAQIKQALEICKKIKTFGVPIVWGGVHPSLFPEQTCKNEFIDYVIIKEGEETIVELVNALKDKTQLSNIKGLVYKENDKIILNSERLPLAEDKLFPIKYDLVDMERHLKMGALRKMSLPTSRGCPSRCAFCINTILYNRSWRSKPVDMVLNEMENLEKKYAIDVLCITDESFFVNKVRIEKILDGMIERKFKFQWEANCRVDSFGPHFIDDVLMEKIKKSKCRRFGAGAESGNRRILKMLKKDITPEQILFSAQFAKKHKHLITYSFMIGLPTETKEEMYETMRFMDQVAKAGGDYQDINGQIAFRPYPGSELYCMCKEKGMQEPNNLEEWPKFTGDELMGYSVSSSFLCDNEEDRALIENVGHYGTVALKTWKNLYSYSPIYLFYGVVCKLRWKLRYFKHPIDITFYNYLKKMMVS